MTVLDNANIKAVSVPATAAAGGGVLAGLLTIFLPLLQDLPDKLTSAEVETAIAAGVVLILGSVWKWLDHQKWFTKFQLDFAAEEKRIEADLKVQTAPEAVAKIRSDLDAGLSDVATLLHTVAPGFSMELTALQAALDSLADKEAKDLAVANTGITLSTPAVEPYVRDVVAKILSEIDIKKLTQQ
jgi:hypothetical protein